MEATKSNGRGGVNHCRAEEDLDDDDDSFLLKVVAARSQLCSRDDSSSVVGTAYDGVQNVSSSKMAEKDKSIKGTTETTSAAGEQVASQKLERNRSKAPSSLERAGSEQENTWIEPGAHAVGGPQEQPNDSLASDEQEEDASQDLAIDDAFLVVNELESPEMDVESGMLTLDTETFHEEVFQGQILGEKSTTGKHQGSKQLTVSPFLLGAALLVGVILVVVFTLSSAAQEETGTVPTTASNNTVEDPPGAPIIYPPFQEGLPHKLAAKMQEVGSAYYKANAWMWNDPHLQSYSLARKYQRYNMVWSYFVSNGHNWTRSDHWLSYNVSECEWFMHNSSLSIHGWHEGEEPLPVCDEDSNLLVTNLSSNNLQGHVPEPSPPGSAFIKVFDLSDNDLSGNLPTASNEQSFLEVLSISNNHYEGFITAKGTFSISNLRIVKFDGNGLYGGNEMIYYFLPRLEFIDTTGNPYSDVMPKTLHACKNLTHASYADTGSWGTIPTEFGLITSLQELDVSSNPRLNGTLPSELGLLTSLTKFNITGTSLAGNIPEELCNRAQAGLLDIFANCSQVECCSH